MSLLSSLRSGLSKATGRARPRPDIRRHDELIDAAWYLAAYPDVVQSGRSPWEDFFAEGASKGRNPNPFFDTSWYLDRYPDVRTAGIDPLAHYLEKGAAEGRDPGPKFETRYYLRTNPDVATSGINPLLHYLRVGRAEGRSVQESAGDSMEAYEAALLKRRSLVGAAPLDHVHFPLHPRTGDVDAQGKPLPPLLLAQRIGAPDFAEYEWIGRGTFETIRRSLPEDFEFRGARVLDFGCGVGRVLRYFSEEAKEAEFWGCDIDGRSIRWCVENLSPPFRFFQISEIPTIPLESDSFDLIYAISVFAHIHADWHHWMAEVRRILKPGGYAFVTFMGQRPHEEMLGESYWGRGPDFGKYVKNPFSDWNDGGGPMAFHNPEWIKTYWGNLFDIEFIALEGLLEYQSICLMRKPPLGAPVKTDIPILTYATAQGFSADAVGWIDEAHDRTRGFRESFGVEVSGPAKITGWIAFRGDRPSGLDATVNGTPLDVAFDFEDGNPYRDWTDTVQTAFVIRFDAAPLKAGEYRLEIILTSRGGKRHALSIPLVVLPDEPAGH